MSTTNLLFTADGKLQFTPYGFPSGRTTALRFGSDVDNCCTIFFVQARRCSDNTVAGFWFRIDNGTITYTDEFNVLQSASKPFYFVITDPPGDEETIYYVAETESGVCGQTASTIKVRKVDACGGCPYCEDSTPPALDVTFEVTLEKAFDTIGPFFPPSSNEPRPAYRVFFDILGELPSGLCVCKVNDCNYFHLEKNAVTLKMTWHQLITDTATWDTSTSLTGTANFACDLYIAVGKHGTFWGAFAYLICAAQVSGDTLPSPLLTPEGLYFATVFLGEIDSTTCADGATIVNDLSAKPKLDNEYPFGDFPWYNFAPAGKVLYPNLMQTYFPAYYEASYYTLPDTRNENIRGFIAGWGGSCVLVAREIPCDFEPKYAVTIVGTVPLCNGTTIAAAVVSRKLRKPPTGRRNDAANNGAADTFFVRRSSA
jgi:hypothetical protein